MALLDYISGTTIEVHHEVSDSEDESKRKQNKADSEMLAALHAMRMAHVHLQGGAIRNVIDVVKEHLPELHEEFESSVNRATDQVAELRATLAFLLDEDDDAELGLGILPDAGDPLPPGPSRPWSF